MSDNKFQSTRPAGDATQSQENRKMPLEVSIHASRGGRDDKLLDMGIDDEGFNPRVPRGTRLSIIGTWLGILRFNPRVPRGTRHNTV